MTKKRNNKKEETWSDWNPGYLNLREHLSLECLGQVWLNSFSIFLLAACTEPTMRMHRLMCIFVISRCQTSFSHEMTVISKIYCQNLKDKTSILSLGQIIKMCYCRIHAHIHAWTVPWLTPFSALKYVWAYNETQIDLGVSPSVWSGFTLLMTTFESASLIIFRCLLNRNLNVLKTHGSLIQAANSLIEHDGEHACWNSAISYDTGYCCARKREEPYTAWCLLVAMVIMG